MAYAGLDDLKTYLGIDTTTDDGLLNLFLKWTSSRFDAKTGRSFTATSKTRYFGSDALDDDRVTLWLDDDLISISTNGLTNGDSDGTTIASTEYWLMPRNEGPPYRAIRLKSDSDDSWEWDTDCWVSVLGMWGWATNPPDDVVKAIIEWSAYCYWAKDTPGMQETTVFPEAGLITVPRGMPVSVQETIDSYRRRFAP